MAEVAPWDTPAPQQSDQPPWEEPKTAGTQGGLIHAPGELAETIPKFLNLVGTPEGREALWRGTKQEFENLIAPFKTYGEALVGKPITEEQEMDAAFAGATLTMGAGTKVPFAKAVAPVLQEFNEAVMGGAAARLDAFARTGSPDGVKLEMPIAGTKPEPPIVPPRGPGLDQPLRRSEAALTGDPVVDMVLNHPLINTVVDRPIIDRSHEIPNSWGGSVPTNDATMYLDREFPKSMTVDGVTFDPAEPATIHENVEEFVIDKLMAAGMHREQALRTAYWGWGNPAEHAWYRAHGMDPEHVEAAIKPYLDAIASREANAANIPSNLFRETYPNANPLEDVAGAIEKPTPGEMSLARDIIRNAPDLQPRSAEPILQQARNLGVIGPPKELPVDEKPAVAAQRAIPAARTPDDKITMTPSGEPIDAFQQRFETWVDKIETTEDIKSLIRDSADENNNFVQARAGTIPAEHIEKIAEAAGIDPAEIKESGLRSRLRNDDHVRMAEQLLLQVTQNFRDIAEEVATAATPENKIQLAQALVKRDHVLEYVLGLRAEWGRTGNALQEILRTVKDEQGLTDFLKERGNGRTVEDLVDLARGMRTLDDAQVARVLTNQRGQPPGWFFWMWTQGLISGPITHTKYIASNALYAEMEHGVVTPIAAMVGAAKRALGADVDRVFLGEAAAAHWGAIAGVPDAMRAAWASIKNGTKVPLQGERELYDMAIAAGEKPPKEVARAIEFQPQRPEGFNNIWGSILGKPGDVAGAIHTTFKFLGYAASNQARAYRAALADGLRPADQQFWERVNYHAENPSAENIKANVYDAYKGTFMQPLGPASGLFQAATKKVPGLRWIFPFTHIPVNILKAGYEYTPGPVVNALVEALGGPESKIGGDILGKNGGVMQDKAIARMIVGGGIMAYFMNKYLNGKATGDYPTDPKEREDWKNQNKPANSMQIGGEWISFDRLGPPGDLARLGADVGTITHHYDGQDDNAMGKAAWMTMHAAANLVGDTVGFLSVRNLIDAIEDERKGAKWLASQAGSFIPYSSLTSQIASIHDPAMRDAKSFVDGLKYRIPFLRETLAPKRNPITGEPAPNPGYGGGAGYGILRSVPVNTDPVVTEMSAADYHPTAPRSVIGGVKLTPAQYDRYQATAGPLAHEILDGMVQEPGWNEFPAEVRKMQLKSGLEMARKAAADALQAENPEIIEQGIKNKLERFGIKVE